MLEREIEDKVCKYARKKNMLIYKFTSPNRRSVPDRMFVTSKGYVFFIEFKQLGKKLTEGQERECNRIREQGVRVYKVDHVEEGQRVIDLMGDIT